MEQILKGEIPFVRILIPLTTGIITSYLLLPSGTLLVASSCLILALISGSTYYVVFYKRHYSYHLRWVPGTILHIVIFLTGYNLTTYKSQHLHKDHFSRSEYEMLVITICSEPKLSAGILRFEAEVKQGFKKGHFHSLNGKLLVALTASAAKQYTYADLLLVPASFTEIEAPYNPSEFNYKAYLADHGIYHQTFIDESQTRLLKHYQGNAFVGFAFRLRENLVLKYRKYIPDNDAASVASTLILGYRADLSREILDAYSKTGTMHVLSVSGMHVSIVFIVMLFLLKFMDRSKRLQLIRAALIIILIWCYAIITGFSAAACRAALMLSFVILGKAIQRNQNTYNLLAISAVLLLIYNPFFLFDVGFQLSYLAVTGLVYLYPKIYHLFYVRNWLGDQIWSYLSLSIAAQLATFPLSMYYFHQFPVYFLLSNLFIVLPVTIIMYAGLIFLFIPWDGLLIPLGWFLNKSIHFTNLGLFYIEDLPFANISGIWINTTTYLLIYVLMLMTAFAFLYRNRNLVFAALSVMLILMLIWMSGKINIYDRNQIIFYSLRKNTAIGFLEGKKAIIISDLNPEERTFSYSIQPSMESGGIANQKLLKPGKAFSENNFFYDGNFVQFRDWKLLIWDKKFDKKTFSKPIIIETVLLQGNPGITINELMQAVRFKTLLIDASNADYRIKNWQKQAKENGIDCYVLKKNPAHVISLNSPGGFPFFWKK